MSRADDAAPVASGRRFRAQDVVEYGMLIALVVVVVLLAVNAFGQQIFTWFSTFAGRITTTGT